MENLWQDFLATFASGPMSGGLYAALTLAVRFPMRLASNLLYRWNAFPTGNNGSPLVVLFVGNAIVWFLVRFVPALNPEVLYGAVTTAGTIGLFERHVVAPVVAQQDAAMDKSAVFNPKGPV